MPGKLQRIHTDLRRAIGRLGHVRVGAVKTLVYFSNAGHFASVHLRRGYVLLEFLSDRPVRDARIERSIPLGRSRYVNIVRLRDRRHVDRALAGWLSKAYELGSR